MIVGSGDIASILNDREGAILFAAGVSNSSCNDPSEFEKEYLRLKEFEGDERSLFYFGSINPTNKNTPYFKHKSFIESCVRAWFENYNIIRLGNIHWGTNPNTFLNHIKRKQFNNEPVEIRDELKYMIRKEQLLLLTDNLPLKGKNEISVFGECKKVRELI